MTIGSMRAVALSALVVTFALGAALDAQAQLSKLSRNAHTIPKLTLARDLRTGGVAMAPPIPYGAYAKHEKLFGRDQITLPHGTGLPALPGLGGLHGLFGGHGLCDHCGGAGCGSCGGDGLGGHGLGGHGLFGGNGLGGCSDCGPGLGGGLGKHSLFGGMGGNPCGNGGLFGGLFGKHGDCFSATPVASAQSIPSAQDPKPTAQAAPSVQTVPSGQGIPSGQGVACHTCGGLGKFNIPGFGSSPCNTCGGHGLLSGLGNGLGHGLGMGNGCGMCGGLGLGGGCPGCGSGLKMGLGHKLKGGLHGLLGRFKAGVHPLMVPGPGVDYFVGAGGPVPLTPGYVPYVVPVRSPRDIFSFEPYANRDNVLLRR